MTTPIYIVVGVPCAGKSWVCNQIAGFQYIPHDDHIGGDYLAEIRDQASKTTNPVLIETPFSMSQIVGPLEASGMTVIPVFIVEDVEVLRQRYLDREGKSLPVGHVTRQQTYANRAGSTGSFMGTSSEVLRHLQQVAARRVVDRLNGTV